MPVLGQLPRRRPGAAARRPAVTAAPGARPLSPAELVLALQRTAGNRATSRALGGGVSLHGEAEPTYDGGRSKIAMRSVRRATACTDCSDDDPCLRATGTLTVTYHADVTIRMPEMPPGLTACQQGRVRDFLRRVLRPHEEEHARRCHTYDGTTVRPFTLLGCGRADVQQQLQTMHETEATDRADRVDALSAAIDPFTRDFELDCT